MSFLRLPNEVVILISDNFTITDDEYSLNALLQTCQRFASLLNKPLYQHNAHRSRSTALGWAARYGLESTARYALEAGSSVTEEIGVPGFGSWPPMAVACRLGHRDIVRLLIKHGANLNLTEGRMIRKYHYCQGLYYRTTSPIILAVESGHKHIVKLLLSKGASSDNNITEDCITPLRTAVIKGHLNIVKLLEKQGCNFSQGNLLADAARGGHYGIVSYLMRSPKMRDYWQKLGYDALTAAAEQGDSEIVGLLLDYGVNSTMVQTTTSIFPLALAVKRGNFTAAEEIKRSILSQGTILEICIDEIDRQRLLSASCGYGWDIVVETLLKQGCPPHVPRGELPEIGSEDWSSVGINSFRRLFPGRRYGSPLALASHRGHYRVVENLLLYGGAGIVDPQTSPGPPSPLFFAIIGGHSSIVKLLLDYGANPHFRVYWGVERANAMYSEHHVFQFWSVYQNRESPFSQAFKYPQNREILKLILDAGAGKFETLDKNEKQLILHDALMQGNLGMVDFLHRKVPFADFFFRKQLRSSKLSLILAVTYGGPEALGRLFEFGYRAGPSTFSRYHQNVLEVAVRKSDVASIKLIFKNIPSCWADICREYCPLLLTQVRGNIAEIAATMDTLITHGVLADTPRESSLINILRRYENRYNFDKNMPECELEEYISLLLDHGADPLWTKDCESNSVLKEFAKCGRTKSIEIMLKALERRGFSLNEWKCILNDAEGVARKAGKLQTAAFLNSYYYRMKYPVPNVN